MEQQQFRDDEDDEGVDEGAPLRRASDYQWKVRVGVVGDLYRSVKTANGDFQWRFYEPAGPISFHPFATDDADQSESSQLPILKIVKKSAAQNPTTESGGVKYKLEFITDDFTEGQRVPNPVSGMASGLMEFDVQKISTGEPYNLIFGAYFNPDYLLAIMPRWDQQFAPIGMIRRKIDKKTYLGVVCQRK